MARKKKQAPVEELVEQIVEEVAENPIPEVIEEIVPEVEEKIEEALPVEESIKEEPKKDTIDQILIDWKKLGIKGYPKEGMIVEYKLRQWKIIRIFIPVVVLHRV